MKTKHIEAVLDSKWNNQDIDCIQLGNLYVCADKTNRMGHLIYDCIDWPNELRRTGFTVNESEMTIEVNESTFNELNLKYYELADCEIYFFSDLAVKVDDTLEVFCKKNITLQDVVQKWKLEDEPENMIADTEYSIPKNAHGNLAIEMEKLGFDVWDSFFRCPGETVDSDERLQSIAGYYQGLSDGESVRELMRDALYELKEVIDEYKEKLDSHSENSDYEYDIQQMKRCGTILNSANKLLGIDSEMDISIKLQQAHNDSEELCLDEDMEER